MKSEVTQITERGQVSFPAALRRRMRLKTGQKLRWESISETEVRLHVVPEVEADPEKALGFGLRLRKDGGRRTADWLKELREGE